MTWGFVTCGPNEALVISGCCYSKPHLVPGGRAFIWPSIQRIQRISLNTMTLQVDSATVYTSQGVPISVTGIAQVNQIQCAVLMPVCTIYTLDYMDAINDDLEVFDLLQYGLPRRVNQRHNHLDTLDDLSFFRRFRLTKDTVIDLLRQIEGEIEFPYDRNNSVAPINQLLLTLRFYATGKHLMSVGDFSGTHTATASRTIARVTKAIARLAPHIIRLPDEPEQLKKMQNDFYDMASFPKVVAAIDGTHIKIVSPGGHDAEIYRNRKQYFSINTQAMCNGNMEFVNIVARWPGSAHDATIFNNSGVKGQFDAGQFPNCYILGDSGYKILPYLLTPVLNPRTDAEQLYNESHIRTRNIIERTFGVWKRRFPVLAYGCRLKLETTMNVIVATAVLHNMARQNREEDPPLPDDINDHELQQIINNGHIQPDPIVNNAFANIGMTVRRNLIQQFFSRL